MLTIAFLHTLNTKDKIPPSKCELKPAMDVESCHFSTGFMDFGSQNDACPPPVNVGCN